MPNTLTANHLLIYFNSKPETIIKKNEISEIKALPSCLAQPVESPSQVKAWKYQ